MTNLALYRKYRPKKFTDVIGQDHIVSVLSGAIDNGNTTHAYLFVGPRGTGKTSVARILSREAGCNEEDLYEIDGASNRKIDDIRALRDEVRTLPFNSKIKVYIIDEVHMLTSEAFNALLKTLEEPPAHVMFILATTDLHKVPETIVSRCQTFTFKKPSQEILRKMVVSVAKNEGYTIDKDSVNLIALLGDGSFRDTQGILQKVTGVSADKKISIDDVERVTGAPKSGIVKDFIGSIVKKDIDGALGSLGVASTENVDMKTFMKMSMRLARLALLSRLSPKVFQKTAGDLSDEDAQFIAKLSESAEQSVFTNILREFIAAYEIIEIASVPELPVELALTKLIKG